jgi:Tfp pilus assembly pilus retraction ATPase PilT
MNLFAFFCTLHTKEIVHSIQRYIYIYNLQENKKEKSRQRQRRLKTERN